MAEFTHIDLRAARESRKMPRWKLASEVGVSEDTIERWEIGKQLPDPDDVGNIERVVESPGLWHKWMMSHYDSYRERFAEVPSATNLMTEIIRMEHEIEDVSMLFREVEKDALDGTIDNHDLRKRFKQEAKQAMAAIQQVIDRLPEDA